MNDTDYARIASYPTFVGQDLFHPLNNTAVDDIPVGSEVEVSFGDNINFTQPRLERVISIMTSQRLENTPQNKNSPKKKHKSGKRLKAVWKKYWQGKGSSKKAPPSNTNASDTINTEWGLKYIADALAAATAPVPTRPAGWDKYFYGYGAGDRTTALRLSPSVIEDFVKLYQDVQARGGVMTCGGAWRYSMAQKSPKKGGEASFSFHHIGRAFDLAKNSGTMTTTKGATGQYKKGNFRPFLLTVDEKYPDYFNVWCQVVENGKPKDPSDDPGEGNEPKPGHPTKSPGWRTLDVIVKNGAKKYKTIKQRVYCFSFTDVAASHGWDRIGPTRGKSAQKLASGKQSHSHGLTEWWHFQNARGLKAGDKFVDLLATTGMGTNNYGSKGSWIRIKEENAMAAVEDLWARSVQVCDNGKTDLKKVKQWPLRDEIRLSNNRKAFTLGKRGALQKFYKKQTGATKLGPC